MAGHLQGGKGRGSNNDDLRRTFGSRFLEAGNDMHTVRDVLGHSSVTMTNTYLATEDAGQAEAFAKFERRKLRRVV